MTMDRMGTVRTFKDAERARASDETVINEAPFVMRPDVVADGSAYRDAHLSDHGPDLDDWLDETEALGKT
jgi:hypothetical protein